MRWCAALAIVLVALMVVTVKIWRHPRKRLSPPAPPDIAEPAAPPSAPAPSSPVREARAGIAHLRGRVLFPGGGQPAHDVEVVAEDGARTIAAQITRKDRFQSQCCSGADRARILEANSKVVVSEKRIYVWNSGIRRRGGEKRAGSACRHPANVRCH